jgi:Domain of unknown function (DUF5666)
MPRTSILSCKRFWFHALLAIGLAPWLWSCGGGGDQLAGGGIGGTGSALGPVEAKGSLTVNGVKFDTDSAAVSIEGQPQAALGDTSNIEEGMTVLIRGTYDSAAAGRASEVIYLRDLLGPVAAINTVNNSVSVLGHTVMIDDDPVLGTRMPLLPNRLADLRANDLIEVSGFPDGQGNITASFIRRVGSFVNGVTEIEVKGVVRNLDAAATTFQIGNLTLDYDASGGTQLKNLTLGDLALQPFVAVKGTTLDASGRLVATIIERIERPISPGTDRRLEVQGLITACVPVCSAFQVAGQRVVTDARTAFRNGAANDLIDERKVEVEGTINAAGELAATQVSFVKGSVKIEALADASADAAAQTVSVLGISVKANSVTQFSGGVSLNSISAGQALKILGYRIGDQAIIATRIEADSGGSTRLEGPLQSASKADASLTILGVRIQTDQVTGFADSSGSQSASITFDRFFDTTLSGAIVSARGIENPDNQLNVTGIEGEIEIESRP